MLRYKEKGKPRIIREQRSRRIKPSRLHKLVRGFFIFLLGHVSVQTTERYLGCKQKLSQAVNDNLGLEDTGWCGHGPEADFWTIKASRSDL
jgi:hypothetical protein